MSYFLRSLIFPSSGVKTPQGCLWSPSAEQTYVFENENDTTQHFSFCGDPEDPRARGISKEIPKLVGRGWQYFRRERPMGRQPHHLPL